MSETETYLSSMSTTLNRVEDESKKIWWEINAVDKKLNGLILIGLFIAVLLLVNVIHHW